MWFDNFFMGRTVFITGHTGFKGSWLSTLLTLLGSRVVGYSLEAERDSMFDRLNLRNTIFAHNVGDIRNISNLKDCLATHQPCIVFHLAAQPLVRESYRDPVLTYETNIIGTLNVLEAARNTDSVRAFINVTTDKVYENLENDRFYEEADHLGGHDMYSSSKACSEILTSSYRCSFLLNGGFALATARSGNVIGGGDFAKDRLIPDIIRSTLADTEIVIRNPESTRPWQHVLEPLFGYLLLAQKLIENPVRYSDSFNFGPNSCSVFRVIDVVKKFTKFFGEQKIRIEKDDSAHEAGSLQLNIDRAKRELGFCPTLSIDDAVSYAAEWYKNLYNESVDMRDFTQQQIIRFLERQL